MKHGIRILCEGISRMGFFFEKKENKNQASSDSSWTARATSLPFAEACSFCPIFNTFSTIVQYSSLTLAVSDIERFLVGFNETNYSDLDRHEVHAWSVIVLYQIPGMSFAMEISQRLNATKENTLHFPQSDVKAKSPSFGKLHRPWIIDSIALRRTCCVYSCFMGIDLWGTTSSNSITWVLSCVVLVTQISKFRDQ